MTRRSFYAELKPLVYALRGEAKITGDPVGQRILGDFDLVVKLNKMKKQRRFLVWGLLIGRSIDSFTALFLSQKRQNLPRKKNTFNNRIRRICKTSNPLTRDPTIRNDLDKVRRLRNDLFHDAGKHFSDGEMQTFVFGSTKCIQQLILDL